MLRATLTSGQVGRVSNSLLLSSPFCLASVANISKPSKPPCGGECAWFLLLSDSWLQCLASLWNHSNKSIMSSTVTWGHLILLTPSCERLIIHSAPKGSLCMGKVSSSFGLWRFETNTTAVNITYVPGAICSVTLITLGKGNLLSSTQWMERLKNSKKTTGNK